ncbi:MAG: PIN domain-containing protein [Patescibacteria group bacterium]
MTIKMTDRVFVDSSVWVANLNIKDVWHQESGKILRSLAESETILVITGQIISEVVGKVRLRVDQATAAMFYENILKLEKEGVLIIEGLNREIEERAMRILNKFPDLKKLSFVDACSTALVDDKKASSIATFDRDFLELGINVYKPRSVD